MKDGNGNRRNLWVMVNHDGHRRLFELVEVESGGDAARLARDLHAPAVVVDMALPALPALDESPARHRQSASSRLILLNVRTAGGTGADAVVVVGVPRESLNPGREPRQGEAPSARIVGGCA